MAERPRISQDFLDQHRRDRLVTALAGCIVEKGYRGTTVADVVSGAHVARNTFYDQFGSKDEAARNLLKLVVPVLEVDKLDGSIFVLVLEIVARLKLDDQIGASALIADAEQLLDREVMVEPFDRSDSRSAFADPILSTLPPGRHGLPRDFVLENQRTRLLAGTARAVYENGYEGATIADITRLAAVSRRTFYEHFDGKALAVGALIDHSCIAVPESDSDGLAYLWVEILAAAFCGDEVDSESKRRAGQPVLRMLAAQLDVREAA